MYWKSVTGLVAVSLAVAHAADDSSAGTIAPPNIPIADSPSDIIKLVTEAPSEGNATNSLVTLPPIDANATVTTSPVASNATMIDDVKVDAEPACSAEKDVDYVGNDLKSVLGAVGDCCTKCQGTSGCKAYSWSDYNGGTCWLKTGRGATKTVAGVTSGVVSVVGKRVEENTDYIGNDISNVPGKDVDSCFDKCQAKSGCKAFSWSDHEGGTCWLKSARGQTKTVKGVHSAELPSGSDTSGWIVETDVDYVGNDLTDFPAKTADKCKPLCVSYPNCQAYTWSDWNGGTCFLKAIRGAVKSQKGVTSGSVKYPEPSAGQCNIEQNKDYIGKDIGNAAATDASFCCKLCTVKVGCEAYTWSSWAGGRCWFKSGVTGSKNSDGAVSGKVVSGTSAPHIAYKIRSGEVPSRAVNLGGWLVTESWMSRKSPAWREFSWNDGWNGEYWAMNQYGKEKGTKLFEEHRAGWITENDIAEIASVGLNMVRVPVGFWIVDDIPGVEPTPISSVFARGALKYLDRLINEWAVKYNVGVYLSLHAHQGSQNGADHSAAQVRYQAYWSKYQNNVDNSFRMATILAARYKDVPSFVGLQLMNEPDSDTDIEVVKKYYIRSYKAIRADGNDCVIGVSPMLKDQSQNTFRDFMRWPEYSNVWVEWHVYYKWGFEKSSEDQIIAAVKNYRTEHFSDWPGNWLLIGEWSLGNGEFEEKFKDKAKLKEFAEAQVQSYSEAHAGWSFWSWHHDDEYNKEADGSNTVSGWNLRQLLRLGIFKVPGY